MTRRKLGATLPQNFSSSRQLEERYRRAIESGNLKEIASARKTVEAGERYWNHMPARLVRQTMPDDAWQGLFKFTIDRHPYEKVISQAFFQYARQRDPKPNFGEFLDRVVTRGAYRNFDLYSDGKELLVDLVLRYEDLPACLLEVERRAGLDKIDQIPLTKHQFREDRRPAVDILNRRQ